MSKGGLAASHFESGSEFRVIELGPKPDPPCSIDYCMVLFVELELILDGRGTIVLPTGSVVVQRGTSHAWRGQ